MSSSEGLLQMPWPPPTDWAPPLLSWLSWGEFYIAILLFLIVMILLIKFFFPSKPGERPSTISMILVIIAIIIAFALVGVFMFLP